MSGSASASERASNDEARPASASIAIFETATGGRGRHTYLIRATRDREPLAGVDVIVLLQGDGSLAPNFSSQQIRRETNQEGVVRVTWYRRSIYGRDVRAQLSVTCAEPGAAVTLEETEPEASTTSYDIPGQHKWRL